MTHSCTWEESGLIRKFTDEVSPEEILKSNFEIHADPRFYKIKYIINDFTKVTKLNIDSDHAKLYASTDDIISNSKGELKIAIVTELDAHFALANSYRNNMLNRYFECEIFKTMVDAEGWVNS